MGAAQIEGVKYSQASVVSFIIAYAVDSPTRYANAIDST